MRLFIRILISLSVLETTAQNWEVVSTGKFNDVIVSVMCDSVHSKVIVSGTGITHIGNLNTRGVASWNGIKWDSLAGGINTHNKSFQLYPQGALSAGISYNGNFLAGGYFSSIGGVNITGLALWNGTKWDSLPKRAFRFGQQVIVNGFLKKGNLLYIIGMFDTIAGQPTNGIATWDGTNFNSILLPIDSNFQSITSITEYQNEIYITGGAFVGGKVDVLKYNGSSWVSTTGGGFTGPFAGPKNLVVYNNELYAGGYFDQVYGNAGNNIIKWDGTHWSDVGFGTIGSYLEINKMLVYHNKLWIFGYFSKAANSFAGNVAVYDGTTWCGLKDTLDNIVASATIFNDTIYISGAFLKANSDSVEYIAKLKDPSLYNQCINVVSINELSEINQINVFPNPTTSILNITDKENQLQSATIEIKNYLGQTVFSSPFTPQINLQSLSAGMYFLTVEDKYSKKTVKIIKQ